MKILFATGLAFAAMATATLAQQPPAPPPAPTTAQSQPATPLTAVPEVMSPAAPPAPGRDVPPPPAPRDRDVPPPPAPRDMAMRGHDGHRPPPPPPSKAAHFRIEDGSTKIDIKCADDEPTKVCADVLLQIMDKLAPTADRSDDDRY